MDFSPQISWYIVNVEYISFKQIKNIRSRNGKSLLCKKKKKKANLPPPDWDDFTQFAKQPILQLCLHRSYCFVQDCIKCFIFKLLQLLGFNLKNVVLQLDTGAWLSPRLCLDDPKSLIELSVSIIFVLSLFTFQKKMFL